MEITNKKNSPFADGINIIQNNVENANQEDNHFHLHAIPRCKNNDLIGEGIDLSAPLPKKNSDRLKRSLNASDGSNFR